MKSGLAPHVVHLRGSACPRVKPVGQVSVNETPAACAGTGVADGDRVGVDDAVAGGDVVTPSDFVTEMSAWLATVVVAVAELFAVMLSLGDVTVAVFDSVPGTAGAVTTIVKVAVAPAAIDGDGCR